MYLERFQSALARSARKPPCAKVNLPLWYALKRAQLLHEREILVDQANLKLPCVGDTVVLLDPDLTGADFVLLEKVDAATPSKEAAPARPDPQYSPSQRWMGRY